jgi:hypothetical protein
MTLSLPIPSIKVVRRQPKVPTLIRIVPEPKTFTLPVTWEETTGQPVAILILVDPSPRELSAPGKSLTRRTTPLELRLDPTL